MFHYKKGQAAVRYNLGIFRPASMNMATNKYLENAPAKLAIMVDLIPAHGWPIEISQRPMGRNVFGFFLSNQTSL